MPAKGQTGWHHSEETRKKISAKVQAAYDEGRLVHWKTGRHDIPSPMKGCHHTEETKAQISANRKGKGLGNQHGFTKDHIPWNKGKPHFVHNDEWRAKVSKANAGANHWNWKGDIDSENRRMRNSTLHKEWSLAVFRKDRWTCQTCGYQGREIVAHHIIPWAKAKHLRFEVSNGTTLCRACHCSLHKPRTGTGKPPKRQLP